MPEKPLTVTFAPPHGDKIATEIRAIAKQFGLAESEAIALVVGFGMRAMIDAGLIGSRASKPMSRSQFLRETLDVIAQAEEHGL